MGNYDDARKFNGQKPFTRTVPPISITHKRRTGLLIEKEPGNLQAHSLDQLIEQGMKRG